MKVEGPNFDPTIVDHATGAVAAPLSAATVPSAAAFNLLPDNVRPSMGMYRWYPATKTYSLSGSVAAQARTAP